MAGVALVDGVAPAQAPQRVRGQGAVRGGLMLVGGARTVPTRMASAAWFAGDAVSLLGIVFGIPFVILAVGLPIALVVQLLLWLTRLL